jgi:L-asparaginase II
VTDALPVVAEVDRSGFVESTHRGAVLAVRADGSVAYQAGPADLAFYPRSALKPLQAVAMVRAGLDVTDEQLALVAASHSGEPEHVAVARSILASAGLSEADLGNVPSLPLDQDAATAVVCGGGGPERIYQNCSGKHAGMLATTVAAGWPRAAYRAPDHPLQRVICSTIEELAGEPVTATGVDGCGAPAFAVTIRGVARAFAALAVASPDTA